MCLPSSDGFQCFTCLRLFAKGTWQNDEGMHDGVQKTNPRGRAKQIGEYSLYVEGRGLGHVPYFVD